MKNYDKVFNSEDNIGFKGFQLATGYTSLTEILFEKENVVVKIQANGHVDFVNCGDTLLASFDVPSQTGGKETYNDVFCDVDGNTIIIKFPVVEWIDNYPNCDGEYDRWDTKIIGYHILNFNCDTKEISLS